MLHVYVGKAMCIFIQLIGGKNILLRKNLFVRERRFSCLGGDGCSARLSHHVHA
ncbi:hypothetical protein J2S06_002918 [Bacillus alveayuensis]|uniref:Uncharacterized protein n=1 Tax=Aeribacillus alveayuensis TaxID=279215 RepID=A0ABT9VS49_9BACI|nr:hypothetical protein [Bacillus alveayuensis]